MKEPCTFLSGCLMKHKSLKPLPLLTVEPPETSLTLVFCLDFPLEKLPHLIITNNVDGTSSTKGTIQWKAHADILFKEKTEKLKLMILSLGKQQIILGMPWLKKWNPTIDWRKHTLALPEHPLVTETPLHKYSPQKKTILKENPEVPL